MILFCETYKAAFKLHKKCSHITKQNGNRGIIRIFLHLLYGPITPLKYCEIKIKNESYNKFLFLKIFNFGT